MSISDAIGGGLISGVGSLAGGLMTNSAAESNTQSAEEYQTAMSDTAHQREVADLKAAGLNPILSAGGSGASAPGITAAPVVNALGNAMQAGVTNFSALQSSRQVDPAIDYTKSQTVLNNALSAKAAADTTSALADARQTDAQTAVTRTGYAGRFLGGDAASAGASLISNASDLIGSKLQDVISSVTTNAARKVYIPPPPRPNYAPINDIDNSASPPSN